MTDPLKGHTQTAQTRLPDGRQVLGIAIDREGVANLLDRPDAVAVLEVPDLLGHGPVILLLLAAEPAEGDFPDRFRALLVMLATGAISPAAALLVWESRPQP